MAMPPKEIIGIATGIVGLAGAALAAIRYFAKKEQLEGDLKRIQERYTELDLRYKEAVEMVGKVKLSGSAALLLKAEIDNQLDLATKALRARASSILVPLPGKNPQNLVFLALFGPAAPTLRRTTVPLNKGIAAHVFTSSRPYLATDTRQDKEFFKGVDILSSYTTTDILCVPITTAESTIGVLQFLNKELGAFTEQDLQVAQRLAEPLAQRVSQFISDPQNFELLGFAPAEVVRDGTIVFCDLTASSLLIDAMNFSSAISLINAYLEKSCNVIMQYGGTIDKLLGDGGMFRFNVPHEIPDSRMQALRAAIGMRDAFQAQKDGWLEAGMPANALFTRIGIASGPVREAIMGHPQFQSLTVVGEPVILSSNLCLGAPRDRNVILASAETVAGLESQLTVRQLPGGLLRKIKGQQATVYELLGCRPRTAGS